MLSHSLQVSIPFFSLSGLEVSSQSRYEHRETLEKAMDLIEKFFVCLGAAVSIYCGMKLLLFSRMLFPKMWFPLPETFFTSMGEWAGEQRVHGCVFALDYFCLTCCLAL